MSLYKVTGNLPYRGHKPGEVFTAVMEPAAERRALLRRNIKLLETSKPTLQPGSYKRGWLIPEGEV